MHMFINESLDVFANKNTSVKKRHSFLYFERDIFVFTLNKYFVQKETDILVRGWCRKIKKKFIQRKTTMCDNPMGFPFCYGLRISEYLVHLLLHLKMIELRVCQ